MAKRAAEDGKQLAHQSLKKGERPIPSATNNGGENSDEDFEDEFEDEYESEDELFEAGVDGRPDNEREAEEKGTWTYLALCDVQLQELTCPVPNFIQMPWT